MKIFPHRCVLCYLRIYPHLLYPRCSSSFLSFSPSLGGKWLYDIFSLLLLLYYSLLNVFSFFLFRFSSFSFPSHTSFIRTLSFQTFISPFTANGLVDTNKKERKYGNECSWRGTMFTVMVEQYWHLFIHLFLHLFVSFLVCKFVFITLLNSDEEEEQLLSHPLSFPSEKKMRNDNIAFCFFSSLSSS